MNADSRSPAGAAPRRVQWGGFAIGLVAGLLIGLAMALGVALYITKAPVPFINKVPQRTAEQDQAEAERNRHWDPNAPLGGKPVPRAPGSADNSGVTGDATATATGPVSGAALPPPAAATAPTPAPPTTAASAAKSGTAVAASRDPATILSGTAAPPAAPVTASGRSTATAAEPFVYFVQAGAYTRNEEAEQQRARLAILGLSAKITEREQAGRTVYRVRMGPYLGREEADKLLERLQEQSMEAQIVRVEKP